LFLFIANTQLFKIMKNIKSLFAALALSLFMASCAKENLLPKAVQTPSAGDELQLDLSALLVNDDAILAALGTTEEIGVRDAPQSVVYTLSNETSGNRVIAFNRNEDGTLEEGGRYSTGGNGTGSGLGNQAALALSSGGKFLYVVNPGSNDISFFLINHNGSLTLKDKIASGGVSPISIAVRNGLIYVLNAGGTGNVTGFGFNLQGNFVQLSNSTKALSSPAAGAAQVAFSSNGKALVVTEKATNTISSYPVLSNGRLGEINTFSSAGATPFGFAFGSANNFYVSEAAGGAPGASTISSYHVDNTGTVSLLDGPLATNATAACWVVLTKNFQKLFATNTGSNSISTLSISNSGNLSIANGGNTTPSMSTPIDAAMDKNSDYLYVLATGGNTIIAYSVGNNGQLAQIEAEGNNLPDRMTGLVVR
jgi:6-phosphogluconolactonase